MDDQEWLLEVRHLLAGSPVDEFVGIGPVLGTVTDPVGPLKASSGYADVDAFLEATALQGWKDRVILVKGGRSFRFERIVEQLHRRIHGTVMEVDLVALARNLGVFRSELKPGTRLMVMVKAFAYGSGSGEVARFLQHHHVDYLGVAYTDEGVALRNQGVDLPVMIMNPAPESAGLLAAHNLEPAFYSKEVAETMLDRLRGSAVRIHLKIDTGMHRLGFEEKDLDWLCEFLDRNRHLTVASVYSHLAASESSAHDEFTDVQADRFRKACQRISSILGYQPLRHLLNTSGILRHHEHHYDMVRLGIGLYGVAPAFGQHRSLEQVVTLKTIISQVKEIGPGETVGYGRHGKVAPGTRIGTVSIGYADGYSRAFSNGKGKMLVHGKLAPVVGNVCMDMTMIDLTGIDASEGDEVIIFGRDLPPAEVASWINTIPYELLTAAGERVRRIFHSAS